MLVKVSCWPPFLNFENSCETNNSISGYPNVIHAGGKYCFLSVQRKKLTKEEINHNYITKGVKLFAFLRYYDKQINRQTDQPADMRGQTKVTGKYTKCVRTIGFPLVTFIYWYNLVEEEKAAGQVALEQDVQLVQHHRVGKHEVQKAVPGQSTQLY